MWVGLGSIGRSGGGGGGVIWVWLDLDGMMVWYVMLRVGMMLSRSRTRILYISLLFSVL